ncbi:hypothetical protein OAH12_00070 [Cyclobacteriaceae bacterium]|nr:hypothetical protein [Cyclobacteriaceae bacterium]
MMQVLKCSFLFLVVLTLNSCVELNNAIHNIGEDDPEFVEVVIADAFSIDLPDYMKESTSLNDEAILQYQNIFKETYIVVLQENKSDVERTFRDLGEYNDSLTFAQNYRDIQLNLLKESIDIKYQSEFKNVQIGGLNSEHVQFDGLIPGVDQEIAYF